MTRRFDTKQRKILDEYGEKNQPLFYILSQMYGIIEEMKKHDTRSEHLWRIAVCGEAFSP